MQETLYGLIGKSLAHSFSSGWFTRKFERGGIDAHYVNFELDDIADLPKIIARHPNLRGLNVTIPYKESVMALLDDIDSEAVAIGAVNTIAINNGKLTGYNTDHFGFASAIRPFLESHMDKAIILGTGGASKAVAYALGNMGIAIVFAGRSQGIPFDAANDLIPTHHIIINSTPIGTFPDISSPEIAYEKLTSRHLAFDLVYNPPVTPFMTSAMAFGAKAINGHDMLVAQAEKSWEIWQIH